MARSRRFRGLACALAVGCLLAPMPAARAQTEEAKAAKVSASAFAEKTCKVIEEEAARNGLPAAFFARLIWRESLFNPRVVSPKGAQGIAQFMPGTAAERGLADPFEPVTALAESAKYLTELKARLGSLGLAAAAYNAGPSRVAAWLKGGSDLPLETQDYVLWITGHTPEAWSSAKTTLDLLPIAEKLTFAVACRKLAARGLTAKLPDRSLRSSGWQALFASGLGIKQVKASKPGRIKVVIDLDHAPAAKAGASRRTAK